MNKDQTLGVVILIASVVGILIYGGLLFFAGRIVAVIVLEITAFVAVAGVLAILAWIGYTLATTPPPQPIEEIEKEIQMSTGASQAPAATQSQAPASTPATQQSSQSGSIAAAGGPAQTQTPATASEQVSASGPQQSGSDSTEQKSKAKPKSKKSEN